MSDPNMCRICGHYCGEHNEAGCKYAGCVCLLTFDEVFANRVPAPKPISHAMPYDLKKIMTTAIKSVEARPDYVLRPNHAATKHFTVQHRRKPVLSVKGSNLIADRWQFVIDEEALAEAISQPLPVAFSSCDFIRAFEFGEACKFIEHMKAQPENDGQEWIICGFVEVWR